MFQRLVELTKEELKAILDGTATDELKSRVAPADDGGGIIIIVHN